MPKRLMVIFNSLKSEISNLRFFVLIATSYAVFNIANFYMTSQLYLETGAHLIHLPSGIRMVMVLIGGGLGAAAISVATFPIAYWIMFEHQLLLSLVISITTSLIPLTSCLIVKRFIHWENNFSDLTLHKLLIIAITYASFNATIQQLIFYLFDLAKHPVNAWLVMFTGDMSGIVIILYLIRLVGKILEYQRRV